MSLLKEEQVTVTDIPKKIGAYSFVKELHKNKTPKPYVYALYKTTTGKKAFAKIWSGDNKNKNYHMLQNEIAAYKFILKDFHTNKVIKQKFPTIQVPKLIHVSNKKNNVILLLEYVNGKQLEVETNETKITVFKEVFQFLSYLNKVSTFSRTKERFPNRHLQYWLILLPYLSLKGIMINSKNAWLILKANLAIIKNLGFKNSSDFVHRDVGESNIVLNKQGIWLYDFQLSCFSDQALEYAVTSIKISRNKELFKKFHRLMRSTFLKDEQTKRKYVVFSIILFLYEISIANKKDSEIPSGDLKKYLPLLLK